MREARMTCFIALRRRQGVSKNEDSTTKVRGMENNASKTSSNNNQKNKQTINNNNNKNPKVLKSIAFFILAICCKGFP